MVKTKRKNNSVNKEEIFSKETKSMFVFFAILAVIFIVLYLFFGSLAKVEYQGLTFVKEKFEKVNFYRYTYHYTGDDGKTYNYNLYVRTNPKNNDVPIEGEIKFQGKNVNLGADVDALSKCNDSLIAIGSISSFILGNSFNLSVGSVNYEEAAKYNRSFFSCETNSSIMTILLKESENTRITRQNNLCYLIEVNNCDILKAVEKFEVQSIIDAKKYS